VLVPAVMSNLLTAALAETQIEFIHISLFPATLPLASPGNAAFPACVPPVILNIWLERTCLTNFPILASYSKFLISLVSLSNAMCHHCPGGPTATSTYCWGITPLTSLLPSICASSSTSYLQPIHQRVVAIETSVLFTSCVFGG